MKTKTNPLNLLRGSRRSVNRSDLEMIVEKLEDLGYDFGISEILGDGGEAVALSVSFEGEERVLKIVDPLLHDWHPDWGHRPFDAMLIMVEGEEVNELDSGGFWFIQEFAEPIARAEDLQEELWEEFYADFNMLAEDLFLDDTELLKQLGLVERDGEQKIVLVDYCALSSQDMNLDLRSWSS
jgi:hypothetical protein